MKKNFWGKLCNFPEDDLKKLEESLIPFYLKTGQKFNEIDTFPSGILFIETGILRLIGLDEKKDPFTLKKYQEGEVACLESHLRGSFDHYFAASTEVSGKLLPTNTFLDYLNNNMTCFDTLKFIEAWELCLLSNFEGHPLKLKPSESLEWCNKFLENNDLEILYLPPGEHKIKKGQWILSSSNIKDIETGKIIAEDSKVEVTGKIPARLIQKPKIWPPIKTTLKSKQPPYKS